MMTPQSDIWFDPRDAESIRHGANLLKRDFGRKFEGDPSGNYLQRLRDIASRVVTECESGEKSDFTKDDLDPLETLAGNFRSLDGEIDPNKFSSEFLKGRESREDAADAADRIAAVIRQRLG